MQLKYKMIEEEKDGQRERERERVEKERMKDSKIGRRENRKGKSIIFKSNFELKVSSEKWKEERDGFFSIIFSWQFALSTLVGFHRPTFTRRIAENTQKL